MSDGFRRNPDFALLWTEGCEAKLFIPLIEDDLLGQLLNFSPCILAGEVTTVFDEISTASDNAFYSIRLKSFHCNSDAFAWDIKTHLEFCFKSEADMDKIQIEKDNNRQLFLYNFHG